MLDQNTRVASIANFKQEIEGLDLGRVGYDGSSCSELQYQTYRNAVGEEKLISLDGPKFPVSELKIVKNEIEVSGLKKSLEIESAALISVYAQIK